MAVSACDYLTAGISRNPTIRKHHQHVLFDLPCTERFLSIFTPRFSRPAAITLQEETRGPISICEVWIYRMNSAYKLYTVNCRRDLEWISGLLLAPSQALARLFL